MKRNLLRAIAFAAALAVPAVALAAGNFTGFPASSAAGTPSTNAPATGGGPITSGGCIPMDTGNPSGINPATQCVSPSQLTNYVNGVQLSYATAAVPNTVTLATLGNDTTPVSGTIYLAQINIPVGFVVTNISCLNGSAAATDKYVYGLYNGSNGALIASTALAGVTAANTNVFQTVIPLTAPYTAALTNGIYYIALQTNGTTTRFRTITANGANDLTKSQTGVFGTLPQITLPTTFTVNVGPICFVN